MGNWNPLKCAGTALPVPLLLGAKIIAIVLLATNHVLLLPDPFLPFIPMPETLPGAGVQVAIKMLFAGSAVALLLNRSVRASAAILGATTLFAVVSSAHYGTTIAFCGVMLMLLILYAMEATVLVFVPWPKAMTVIYDEDCGICNRVRRWLQAVDFDNQFDWKPLQSGVGERWGIPRSALLERLHLVTDFGVTSGFRACKLLILYNPAFLLSVAVVMAVPPSDWVWYRRILAGILIAFFFPLFNSVGEAAYRWVARNRYRLSSEGACAIKPDAASGLGPR